MKYLILAPLLLASCTASNGASVLNTVGSKPPITCGKTSLDEKALTLAAQSVDVLALSASALVKAGVVTKGSSNAFKLAKGLDEARIGVNSAELAREACNATNYSTALAKATAAIATIRSALGG